jgi:hypothetical protein
MTMSAGTGTKPRKIREEQLALTLMLGLREQGDDEMDNSRSRLHAAFGVVCTSKRDAVNRALGFVPVEHRLFGVFSAVDQALDEGQRDGVLDVSPRARQRIRFAIDCRTASHLRKALWTEDSTRLDELTKSFIEAYKSFSGERR